MKRVKQLSLVALLSFFVLIAPHVNAQKPANAQKGYGIENQIPDLTDKQKEEIISLRKQTSLLYGL